MTELNHTHEFEDPIEFIFEDVLVTEVKVCSEQPREPGPSCDATTRVQWKVQLDEIQTPTDEGSLSRDDAEQLWHQLCEKYGSFNVDYEEYLGNNSTKFKDPTGAELIFKSIDETTATISAHVTGVDVKLPIEKHRVLD